MRLVIALGGNALLRRGERPGSAIQRHHVRAAAEQLAPLTREHTLVVCHGNGPQIGVLARESEDDSTLSEPFPLDDLGAQTQGMIGYWLAQELANAGSPVPVVAVVTRVLVSRTDPAFAEPNKFIGPVVDEREALASTERRGWVMRREGTGWRRVVPSPAPRAVLELPTIQRLAEDGRAIVVCGGGGGIPIAAPEAENADDGSDHEANGVEAVVDKDATAALIATRLHADRLVVLTDVTSVKTGYGTVRERDLSRIGLDSLKELTFATGSMAPKVQACIDFVQATGNPAHIGSLDEAAAVVSGRAGTVVVPIRSPRVGADRSGHGALPHGVAAAGHKAQSGNRRS